MQEVPQGRRQQRPPSHRLPRLQGWHDPRRPRRGQARVQAPQEGNPRGGHHRRNPRDGRRRRRGLRQNTARPTSAQHRVGGAPQRRDPPPLLQELVQVQEEGFHQVRQEVHQRQHQPRARIPEEERRRRPRHRAHPSSQG